VVGNIVGLAAAMIYRGIRFVEMPTTVMGQTDSTLSNKQAVNGRRGKNHFGVYYAPLFIWADRRFLLTEPAHTAKGGLVEAVKNGFISDARFLDYIGSALDGRWPVERERLDEVVPRIIDSKLAILERDPSEKKLGVILEYGHTFGHAIESLERGAVPHGEAVAIGMCLAAELSRALGLCSGELVARHYHVLRERVGVPVRMPVGITSEALMTRMASDNKKTSRGVRFVLLEDVARIHDPEGDYQTAVDPGLVRHIIDAFIEREGTFVPHGAPADLAYV
jgi:3-dehydroquinate synthetase